jgi:hypothetical protein
MVDGDQSSGAGADRTPPLGARGRSSSFPNLAQNAFVAALGVGDGAPRDAAAGAAPAGGSDVGDVAPARASAAWYLPPLGLRHLSEVRARNLVPPRGAEHSRGAGFRFTLAAGGGAGEPEAVVYTSEVATDTLNPDWEPLDDVDLERRARGVVGAAASSSDESARLDRDADEVDATGSDAADRPSAPALTLTVWHVENPASSGEPRTSRVFSTRLALDDLARAPADAVAASAGFAPPRPSVFGPFDVSDADGFAPPPLASSPSPPLAFPPNTPIVRFLSRARWGVGGLGGYDKMGGGAAGGWHGWHVPGGRSWRALRDAAQLAVVSQLADAADAADALDRASRGAGGGAEGGSGAGGGGASTSGSPLSRAGGGGGVGRIERVDARALRASIDAIVHAAAGIARATSRRDALRDAVGERLGSADETLREKSRSGDGGERTRSRPSLAALRGMLGDAKLDVVALRRRVEAHREDARDRAAVNARRRESLVAGSKRLERARASLGEDAAALAGARGRGRLHQQQRALVARRWRLVADLARVFPIAPVRSGGDDDGGGGGGGGGTGGKQKRSWMVAGVPLDLGQTGKPNGAGSLSAAIGHGLLPGSTVSQSEQERRASALGYVTQAVLQLAAVLDVPLRYPVAPGASRSYICDLQQTWASSHSRGDRGGGGGDGRGPSSPNAGDANSSAYTERAVMWRRYEFPLFADGASSTESTKFTYAVFLLNKDLEQLLNAHGLLAVGPRQTLPNLRRLLHGRTNRCEVSAAAGGGGGEVDESVASRVASGEENGGGGYEATVALTR